ncbi:UTP13 [Acanthosepion pharaonis]|uniref:UTP13 n=1 Tax=Acanthosepion pharaonis TaxID=158019 RepID=A0A812D7Y5_ACAPH|nr:UTP13 [Sepia pharaonis]
MSATKRNCLEVLSEYGPFYNSGKISVTSEHLVCTYKSQVNVVCQRTGKILWTIPLKLVVADKSLHLQLFNLETKELSGQSWRSLHLNHIRCMQFNEAGNLLATGGTDSSIKVWDTDYRYCTHSFKRSAGVITSLLFQPYGKADVRLFSGAESGEVCLFDLRKKSVIQASEHHSSAVTDMVLSEDNKTLISAGRDSIVTLWTAENLGIQKTVAVFEPIESLLLVTKYFPNSTGHCFITAGSQEHEMPVMKIVLINQGRQVLSGTSDGFLNIWDLLTQTLQSHMEESFFLSFQFLILCHFFSFEAFFFITIFSLKKKANFFLVLFLFQIEISFQFVSYLSFFSFFLQQNYLLLIRFLFL